MRAAIISERGATPSIQDFPAPTAVVGASLIDVKTTGLGGWDVLGAYRLGVQFPCVIRGEGVGFTADGRRVYFGERSIAPYGSWGEKTIVPDEEVWDIPPHIDDKTAIAMGIAATGALLPLESANIQSHETVLILGATGALGQIALQLARYLGAAKVVAAARDEPSLEKLKQAGLADEIVVLGTDDDLQAHKLVAGDGYDVVLDIVCGQPMLDALQATRPGARIVTIGTGAGREIKLDMAHLLFRTLTTIGTGQRPPAERKDVWLRLLDIFEQEKLTVEYKEFAFEQVGEAWQTQQRGAHAKIITTL